MSIRRGVAFGLPLAAILWVPVAIGVHGVAADPMPPTVAVNPAVTVGEDEPSWNCYVSGNNSCGDSPIVTLPDGTKVAVLDPANDGKIYGSAPDGKVYLLDDGNG